MRKLTIFSLQNKLYGTFEKSQFIGSNEKSINSENRASSATSANHGNKRVVFHKNALILNANEISKKFKILKLIYSLEEQSHRTPKLFIDCGKAKQK